MLYQQLEKIKRECDVGTQNEGNRYIDAIGNCEEEVIIDSDGCGNFRVNPRSVSVWIKK